MNDLPSITDEQLLELLDAALRDSKTSSVDQLPSISRISPSLQGEAAQMAELLFELSKAVQVWRSPDLRTAADEIDESFREEEINAVTLIAGKAPKQIGRYQLKRHVGSGAMGDVYEAHDPQLERCVAIKVPRCDREIRNRSLFTERFVREARAAAAVRHANICPIYDAGETEGQPWVVMAFVEGQSLDALLSKGRFSNIREAVQIAIQIADALGAIHQHGIIHRDLKPGNILIDDNRQALLTDFGLALSDLNGGRITCDGIIVGTPVYMSPEQAAGENSRLTPASDIYSLGAVLYEMLTGQAPFRAPLPELLRMIMLHPVPPVRSLCPDIDPTLAAITEKALSKSPQDRHASAASLAEALRAWLGSVNSDFAVPAVTPQNPAAPAGHVRIPAASMVVIGFGVLAAMMLVIWQPWSGQDSGITTSALAGFRSNQGSPESPVPSKWSGQNSGNGAPAAVPASPAVLTGKVTISISSDPKKGPMKKDRLAATEKGALPLVSGELVQFEVQLNQPAFVYLLWVNPDGTVTPLFPWDSEHYKGWDAPLLPASRIATDRVLCPQSLKEGFEASEPVGLQTVVLMARRTPLEDGIRLDQLLSGLPATPDIVNASGNGPILRGITTGKTTSLEDPQYDALKSRLSAHFELINVVSFPHVSNAEEEQPGAASGDEAHRSKVNQLATASEGRQGDMLLTRKRSSQQ